jgi:hypothetical protein
MLLGAHSAPRASKRWLRSCIVPDSASSGSTARWGDGRACRFRTPGGHLAEIVWDVERYTGPEHVRSRFRNRPHSGVIVDLGAPLRGFFIT